MFMNVQVPPFDNVRVRQAVNYAADRTRIAELAGGPDIAQPTCQVMFTGFTTYAPSCRYTLAPGGARGWTAPDLARARRLVERSGTRGMRIEVWGYRERRALSAYFVSLLGRLGYRASLHYVEKFGDYSNAILDPRQRPQMGIVGWGADYAAPSTAVALYLCDSGDLSHFCDRGLEPRIDQAIAARGPEANRLWQGVYRRIENAAPSVPLFNRRTMALVSKRVGNYQHHPLFGTLYDQMWVR
jgi:peptide/nickel transport system substrate-binding protein